VHGAAPPSERTTDPIRGTLRPYGDVGEDSGRWRARPGWRTLG
jgi:hypothetical protein